MNRIRLGAATVNQTPMAWDTNARHLRAALAAAWRRSAYHEAADLSAYSLDVAARMQPSAERREYEAGLLLQAIFEAAVSFDDYRLPELFCGFLSC